MLRKVFAYFILLFTISNFLYGKENLSVSFSPKISIPLENNHLYPENGLGLQGTVEFSLPQFPRLYLPLGLNFINTPTSGGSNLSCLSINPGVGVDIPFFSWLSLDFAVYAGGYWGFLGDQATLRPSWGAKGALRFKINPSFSLGAGVAFFDYLSLRQENPSLYKTVTPFLTTYFTLGVQTHESKLEIPDINVEPLFPVLYSYYDDSPIGSVTIRNGEEDQITDIKVFFHIPGYMTGPRECAFLPVLLKGSERRLNLYSLFSNSILKIKGDTKIPGKITVVYNYKDQLLEKEHDLRIHMFTRNAVTWEREKMLSSFITYKDTNVIRFSRGVIRAVDETDLNHMDNHFLIGMALFQGLSRYGLSYASDPTNHQTIIEDYRLSIDFLQFPGETLNHQAGDCDDFSILYAALLESLGIQTAFIITPGHIYTAFALAREPEEVKGLFQHPENFIFRNGKTWIPVETTRVGDGFLKAWQAAAGDWKLNKDKSSTLFLTTSEARETYKEPVTLTDSFPPLELPPEKELNSAFRKIYNLFVDDEIGPKAAALKGEEGYEKEDPAVLNRLASLYARYGMLDEAERELLKSIGHKEYFPALFNLGYLYYLKNDIEKALVYTERAYKLKPGYSRLRQFLGILREESDGFKAIAGSYRAMLEQGILPENDQASDEEPLNKADSRQGIKVNDPFFWVTQ